MRRESGCIAGVQHAKHRCEACVLLCGSADAVENCRV